MQQGQHRAMSCMFDPSSRQPDMTDFVWKFLWRSAMQNICVPSGIAVLVRYVCVTVKDMFYEKTYALCFRSIVS